MDTSNHTDDKVKSQMLGATAAESKSDAGSVGQGSVLAADFDPSPVSMTATEAMMLWPYAVVWSSVGMLPVILVAYSPAWISLLYAMPAFTTHFGYKYGGVSIIGAGWQAALSTCAMIGQVFSCPIAAILMDRFGRKPVFLGTYVLTAGLIFVQFFATTLSTTLVGGLLLGCSLGAFCVLSLTYAIELAPFPLRGMASGMYNTFLVLGLLTAAAVSTGTAALESGWAYKTGYAIQWAWPAILMPITFLAPESPVWLIRQGRKDEAEKVLKRLSTADFNVHPMLGLIEETDRHEREQNASTTYKELFQNANLRRTMIATGCYITICVTGNMLVGNTAYFMQLAGVDASAALKMSLGSYSSSFVGSLFGLVLLSKFNRRHLYLWSQVLSAVILLLVGALQAAPNYYSRLGIVWGQGTLFVVWNFVYGAVCGPFSTAIMGEVSSARLRSKTIAVSSAAQFVLLAVAQVIFPYLLNPDKGALQGYNGFVAGGSNMVCLVLIFFYVPETNRPSEELDMLFEHNIKARHFATFDISELASRQPHSA